MEGQLVNTAQAAKPEAPSVGIKEMYYKYIRFLPYFILSVALALLVAFAYLRYTGRMYSASGSMQIKSQQNNNRTDKVEDILSGGNRTQNIQSEIEVLKSRPLMARVVNRLGLQLTYTAMGRIRDRNVYKECPFKLDVIELRDSSRAWSINIKFIDQKTFRVNNESGVFSFDQKFENANGTFKLIRLATLPAGGEFTVGWQPTINVARFLAGSVKVQPKSSGTGIIVINFETNNPYLASDVVNALMVQYDSLTIEQNNYSTDQKLAFIDSRLDTLRKELNNIQLELLNYREQKNLIDVPSQLGASYTKITEADKAILEQEMMIGTTKQLDTYLRNKGNQFTQMLVPSSLGLNDEVLNELVNGYNKTQLERKSLLESNVPPANPAVKELEAVIEQQRLNLLENIRNIRFRYLDVIKTLQESSGSENRSLKELPSKMREMVELERQASTKLALYSLIEGKREEAAISRASTISNSTIIDQASPSNVPIKPNKRMVQMIAALIGLLLPAGIIFLSEILNDKITTRTDIERITDVPIIGEVGHSFSESTLVVSRTSRSMVAEQFRTIRTNLDYILARVEKPVIMVTSSFSGEGKSFVSTNMGAVLALAGKKTIILEFDIRKPKVLSGLGMGKHKGISNFLVGNAALDELILPVQACENLYVLPCGPIPPNPSELLLDQKVSELFELLRQRFDIVIIDTAPVGMVSDALTLSKFADCTLYLARQGHTYKKQVGLIDEIYREKKLPKVSVVINDVKLKPGYGYYGYGRYGYGYGYGYGEKSSYYEEEKEAKLGLMERIFQWVNPFYWFRKK